MESSKHFIAIQENDLSIQVMESKFDRELGFILNVDGIKFKVCQLFESKNSAGHFMYTFQPHLFSFFGFNTKLGRKN
jgi:hypothetical protein